MSAINEWFGYYNAVFSYIRDTYGEAELDGYLRHLAKEAYSDITPIYREGGLPAIAERYVGNFRKDGDETSAVGSVEGGVLTIEVRCPAYTHGVKVAHPARCVGGFFCSCCEKLNREILSESGYDLLLKRGEGSECLWKIKKMEGI